MGVNTPLTADAARARRAVALRVVGALLSLYGLALAAIAFWPVPVDRGAGGVLRTITALVPWLTYPRIEFGANVLLFMPLGVLLALLLGRRWPLSIPIALFASIAIELGQWLFLAERTSSLWDVVANALGAAIGSGATAVMRGRSRSATSARHTGAIGSQRSAGPSTPKEE